ncbi:MAG: hypothetical protein BWY88_00913 [Synergistetes bacterium ADurb.Bin520]|nr:MAG: hypothetical protein BWY88_00913 [Synergistetes bacterium ADurb.Bin520]
MGPSDGLGKIVVPPPSADGVLGAQDAGEHFVGGLGVVIQPSYQALVQRHPGMLGLQGGKHQGEVIPTLGAEAVPDVRGPFRESLAPGIFAVEDAQGVSAKAPLAGVAELGQALPEVGLKRLAVDRATAGAPHGVHHHLESRETQATVKLQGKGNGLHVHQGVRRPDGFYVQLPELAIAPLLRPLVAEHGPRAPKLGGLGAVLEVVLQIGPHHGRRGLGAQGQAAIPPVREGVHLFFHHVGGVADAPAKELRVLEKGQMDLFEAKVLRRFPRHPHHVGPLPGFLRKDVSHSPGRLDALHTPFLPSPDDAGRS